MGGSECVFFGAGGVVIWGLGRGLGKLGKGAEVFSY